MVPGACGGFCTTTLGTVFLDKGLHFGKALVRAVDCATSLVLQATLLRILCVFL